jgi:hypothetical protein
MMMMMMMMMITPYLRAIGLQRLDRPEALDEGALDAIPPAQSQVAHVPQLLYGPRHTRGSQSLGRIFGMLRIR